MKDHEKAQLFAIIAVVFAVVSILFSLAAIGVLLLGR